MGTQIFRAEPIQKKNVAHVLAEAIRKPDHCLHVAEPSPPQFLFGTREGYEAMMAEVLGGCETVKRMRKNRNGVEKPQAIRGIEAVILAGIASFPDEMSKIEPELFETWKRKTIEFLQAEYGDKLRAVLLHTDENNPHLHFFVIPDGLDVSRVFEPHKFRRDNPNLSKKAQKHGEVDILRKQLDRYAEQVGFYTGLARFGPRSRNLQRGEWKREQSQRLNDAKRFVAATVAEKDIEEKANGVAQRENKLAVDVSKARQKLTTLATKAKQVAETIIAEATEEAEAITAAPAKVGARISGFLQGFTKKKAIEELAEEWENRFDLTKRDYAKNYNNVLELYEQNKQSLTRANKKLQDAGISTENAQKPNFNPKPIITIDTGGPK